MLEQDIERNFTYHPPREGQPEKFEKIRNEAKKLAMTINSECDPSRELSLALTNLEQAVFWANASIARGRSQQAAADMPAAPALDPLQFDDAVKLRKAIEFMAVNSPMAKSVHQISMRSTEHAIQAAAEFGARIQAELHRIAQTMEVTDADRAGVQQQ